MTAVTAEGRRMHGWWYCEGRTQSVRRQGEIQAAVRVFVRVRGEERGLLKG